MISLLFSPVQESFRNRIQVDSDSDHFKAAEKTTVL
jgi:hypothetical protein